VALRTYWVLVVMDQYTRRIIGFGVHAGSVDGVGGEFRKFPEFLSFFSLIPSSACATFSLFFCMPSL
jgi:hypothetical protein